MVIWEYYTWKSAQSIEWVKINPFSPCIINLFSSLSVPGQINTSFVTSYILSHFFIVTTNFEFLYVTSFWHYMLLEYFFSIILERNLSGKPNAPAFGIHVYSFLHSISSFIDYLYNASISVIIKDKGWNKTDG